jgi:hypothetical protein
MSKQHVFFASEEPFLEAANALPMRVHSTGRKLSPEQQRFNRQLAELEKLQAQTLALEQLTDRSRPLFSASLQPLRERFSQLERQMIAFLHQRLQGPGLTKTQLATARHTLLGLCQPYAQGGDAAMKAIYDQHSDQSMDEAEQEDLQLTREMLQDEMGLDLSGIEAETAQELLLKALQRQQERDQAKAQALEEKRAAKRSAKKAAAQATLPPKAQSEAAHADPQSLLRSLYRQLASDLHPDRERDEILRAEKTQLMSQANTAYKNADLATLLHLQWRTQQISPEAMAQWSQARLNALCSLLKAQINTAKDQYVMVQQRLHAELQIPFGLPLTDANLQRYLAGEKRQWQNTLHVMESDLRGIEDEKYLKTWLKEQRQIMKEDERAQEQFGSYGLYN